MKPRSKPPIALERQGRLLFVFMVVIGYAITFVIASGQPDRRFTFQELFWGFLFGVVYLFLGLNSHVILDRLPAGWAEALYFSVQCSMLFGIGWVLGAGGTWLIGAPLAGFVVERLAPRWHLEPECPYIGVVTRKITYLGVALKCPDYSAVNRRVY